MNRRRISLTWVVALLSSCIVGGFMILHDAYLTSLGEDVWTLQRLTSHGWHLLAYAVIIFVLMSAIIHRIVVKPIHELYTKLYALTKGHRQIIEIDSPVSEVQQIADGINLLISRPHRVIDRSIADTLRREGEVIRSAVQEFDERPQGSRSVLLKCAARIEGIAGMGAMDATSE